MSTLERAIEIAAAVHAGGVHKVAEPYVLHPIRLMLAVETVHAGLSRKSPAGLSQVH